MKCIKLNSLLFSIGAAALIGIGSHPENAWGAAVTDSYFSWRNVTVNGKVNNFMTAPRDQGRTGDCWAFAAVGAVETWYKITRNDGCFTSNDVWCSNLSEQNVNNYGDAGNSHGGSTSLALSLDLQTYPYNETGEARGIVTDSDIFFYISGYNPPSGWQLPSNLLNRRLHLASTGNGSWIPSDLDTIKTALQSNGPIPFYFDGHAMLIIGWNDTSQQLLVKNSYNNWDYLSYSNIQDAYFIHATGPAYFNGALNSATWTNAQGNNIWDNKSSANWSQDPDAGPYNPWHGAPADTWLNGETAATFDAAGSGTVNVANNTSAYGVVVNSPGYVFNDGSLTITGNHDGNTDYPNNGGINANASVTFNTPITVGAPSTWTVAADQTLNLSDVNLHISTLTIDGPGDTCIGGAVTDIRCNPTFDGLLPDHKGSLTKAGAGVLTLSAANTYTGPTTIAAGTLKVSNVTGSATGSGSVFVEPAATLTGSGIIDGPVTIAGMLSPGNSPGILTVNNHVAFQEGSMFSVEVNGLTAGSQYDQLITAESVSLAGLLDLSFGEFMPTGHDILFLIDCLGLGANVGTFQYVDDSFIGAFNGCDWYITYDADNAAVPSLSGGNDVAIYCVPEPSTLILLSIGAASLLVYGRRKLFTACRTDV